MTTKKKAVIEEASAPVITPEAPAPGRYEVLHMFAFEGELVGPWNAERVGEMPAEAREAVISLGYVRENE